MELVNTELAFKLPENITTVFFGDSHALTSFDPEIINGSFNSSIDSETLFHTFYKMKVILQSNPQIKNVVLTYSFHNLSIAENQNLLYSDRYYILFDKAAKNIIHTADDGQLLKFKYTFDDSYFRFLFISFEHFINSNLLWLKYDVGFPLEAENYLNLFISLLAKEPQIFMHPLFPGTYKSINSNLDVRVINEAIQRHYYFKDQTGYSRIMIEYLFQIADLCYSNGKRLILINTPLHSTYKSRIPDYYFTLHDQILKDVKDKYQNTTYYDFSSVDYPDSFFGDGDHLNTFGLERFSKDVKPIFNN